MDGDGYFTEPFCRNMAWVDLILLANHDDNFFRFRGIRIDVKRGQVGYGLDKLSDRWQWSRGKVERWFCELEKDGKIVRQKNNVTTLLTISNYSDYQDGDNTDGKASSKANGQQTVKQTETNKNYKNVKNDENEKKERGAVAPATFKNFTKDQFYKSIAEFKNDYAKEMLRAFFNHWSEEDTKGKMRFQLEKTWQVKNRLITWHSKPYNQNGTTTNRKANRTIGKSAGAEQLLANLQQELGSYNPVGE